VKEKKIKGKKEGRSEKVALLTGNGKKKRIN